METIARPILAPNKLATEEICADHYPFYVSEKLDGIRCIIHPELGLLSRNGKRTPNNKLWELFTPLINLSTREGLILDGEIWSPKLTFQQIMSEVQSYRKSLSNDLRYWMFDCIPVEAQGNELPFSERQELLRQTLRRNTYTTHKPIEQITCNNWKDIQQYYSIIISNGGEGVMIRDVEGIYKHGRCTLRECNMLKLKEILTADAKIVGYYPLERMFADAERTYNIYGYPESVSKQYERETVNALGGLAVEDTAGHRFNVGVGFNFRGGTKDRNQLWQERDNLIGCWIEFKSGAVGVKDKPRQPVFMRFIPEKEKEKENEIVS